MRHDIQYEKDVKNVELYSTGKFDYYIFTNYDSYSVAWASDDYEYSISTDININQLKEILNSYI